MTMNNFSFWDQNLFILLRSILLMLWNAKVLIMTVWLLKTTKRWIVLPVTGIDLIRGRVCNFLGYIKSTLLLHAVILLVLWLFQEKHQVILLCIKTTQLVFFHIISDNYRYLCKPNKSNNGNVFFFWEYTSYFRVPTPPESYEKFKKIFISSHFNEFLAIIFHITFPFWTTYL